LFFTLEQRPIFMGEAVRFFDIEPPHLVEHSTRKFKGAQP
jgi:hypothetical protein